MGGGGGGGGDGGYAQKQAQIEASKAAARSALNTKFGSVEAPVRTNYTDPASLGDGVAGAVAGALGQPSAQSRYDKDLADYNTSQANKSGRDAIYSDVRTNAFNAGKRGLDETRDKAQRQNGFSLFAQGLNGGSEDIDQNALLGRTYNQGLMDLGAKADSAKAGLQSADEQTRLGLLQSIDNGMDQGSAISSAINSMKNAGDKAAADAQGTNLGDLFANSGALYTRSQAAQGKAAGQDWWNTYNSGASKGPSSARTGMTSSTY